MSVRYFRPTNLFIPDPYAWVDRVTPWAIITLALLILAWRFG